MCIAPSEEQSLFDQCLEVALECPSRRLGAKPVEIGDCEAAVLLCMGKRKGLTSGQLVALDQKVLAYGPLAPLSDFDQLGGEGISDLGEGVLLQILWRGTTVGAGLGGTFQFASAVLESRLLIHS